MPEPVFSKKESAAVTRASEAARVVLMELMQMLIECAHFPYARHSHSRDGCDGAEMEKQMRRSSAKW